MMKTEKNKKRYFSIYLLSLSTFIYLGTINCPGNNPEEKCIDFLLQK